MKTTFDQEEILYTLLKDSPLKSMISGGLYKWVRPDDSDKEDVVINCLPMGDGATGPAEGTIQRGTANVNIYVPDLKVKIVGKQQHQPDTFRMRLLTESVILAFENGAGMLNASNYSFWISNQSTLREPEINQHYVNLRVEFQFFLT